MRLFENPEIYSPEDMSPSEVEEERRYAEQRDMERRISEFCAKEIGWSMEGSFAVNFDAEFNEITIQPEEEEVTLDQLQKLGLLGSVTVSAASKQWSLTITVKAHEGLQIKH